MGDPTPQQGASRRRALGGAALFVVGACFLVASLLEVPFGKPTAAEGPPVAVGEGATRSTPGGSNRVWEGLPPGLERPTPWVLRFDNPQISTKVQSALAELEATLWETPAEIADESFESVMEISDIKVAFEALSEEVGALAVRKFASSQADRGVQQVDIALAELQRQLAQDNLIDDEIARRLIAVNVTLYGGTLPPEPTQTESTPAPTPNPDPKPSPFDGWVSAAEAAAGVFGTAAAALGLFSTARALKPSGRHRGPDGGRTPSEMARIIRRRMKL